LGHEGTVTDFDSRRPVPADDGATSEARIVSGDQPVGPALVVFWVALGTEALILLLLVVGIANSLNG
jgi:hypothetical protein